MVIYNVFNCNKKNEGFTLIELLIVIAITGIIASFGIVSFVGYNQKQQLDIATQDVASALEQAKSQAASNTDTICSGLGQTYVGSEFKTSLTTYEIDSECKDSGGTITSNPQANNQFTLSGNMQISPSKFSIFFHAIIGAVDFIDSQNNLTPSPVIISIQQGSQIETVTIYNSEVIQIN